jgi:hypothetical protein
MDAPPDRPVRSKAGRATLPVVLLAGALWQAGLGAKQLFVNAAQRPAAARRLAFADDVARLERDQPTLAAGLALARAGVPERGALYVLGMPQVGAQGDAQLEAAKLVVQWQQLLWPRGLHHLPTVPAEPELPVDAGELYVLAIQPLPAGWSALGRRVDARGGLELWRFDPEGAR